MRKILSMVVALAMMLGAAQAVQAQAPAGGAAKPLVTISLSGYDDLLADVKFLGQLAGQPMLGQMAEGFLQQATQGKGLAGIDTTRPWGAVVQTDGAMGFPFYAFVPVSDLKATLELLSASGIESEDMGNGVFQIATPNQPAFVKEQSGWAFISNTAEVLANVPADPSSLLGELPKNYNIAVKATPQNLPDPIRQMVFGQLRMFTQMGMQPNPGESDDEFAIRTAAAKQGIEQLVTLIQDLDAVLLGLDINQETSTVYLDVEVRAVPGSKTAEQMSLIAPAATNYAGFDQPGAAVTINFAGKLSDSDVAQLTASIAKMRSVATQELKNQGLSADELALATGLLTDLLDVAQATVDKRNADGGMVMMLKPDAVTMAAGAAIVDGDKLESVAKKLVAAIQQSDPAAAQSIQLDAETHGDVRFHKMTAPVADPEAQAFFGQTVEIILGINNESLYLAGGKDASGLLKQVIDKSKAEAGKEIPPARIAIAATPIAQFIAAAAKDNPAAAQTAAMVAQMLSQHEGKDHLLIVSTPVENGSRLRIEIEQGVLAVIPAMAMQAAMGAGPGGPAGGPTDGPPPGNSPF